MTIKPFLYKATLTDEELDILDGKCSPETQAVCDSSKNRRNMEASFSGLTQKQAAVVIQIINRARDAGELSYSRVDITSCPACDVKPGYYLRSRTSSKGRKGQPDFEKPKTVPAIDYSRGFVTIRGYVSVGCCYECNKLIEPIIMAELAKLPTAVPAWFPGARIFVEKTWNGERKIASLEKCNIVKCNKCGCIQHEREMGRQLTLMSDGTFPAKCKSCGNEKIPFGATAFTRTDDWVVYDIERNCIVRSNSSAFQPE